MPPPNTCCPKDNTRSKNDENLKSCSTEHSFEDDNKPDFKCETLMLVKSFLGPSLEGTVLKTLEFGKTLLQGSDGAEKSCEEIEKPQTKEIMAGDSEELNIQHLLNKGINQSKMKEILNSINKEKKKKLQLLYNTKQPSSGSKPGSTRQHVSKIRSLDSDLKQSSPSPENIKKQLEALIQISKTEPPKQSWTLLAKTPELPVKMTVMPSLCMYKNDAEVNYSSSCDISKPKDCECSGSELKPLTKKRLRNKICQAPEFISNALGPTIDVSIIDNLKMMRNLFSSETGKGEGALTEVKPEVRLQNSEAEMTCRIEELQKKIEELEEKEQCLVKHIEEEEQNMICKRMQFEEEERRMCEKRACFELQSEEKQRPSAKCQMDTGLDAKYENLQAKIACEEEKLSRLKCQFDQYKSDIAEAKMRKEALKKNKCVLDAWDVFASRVCHTRLPSYSRAHKLEPKEYQSTNTANVHCCLPPISRESSKSRCGIKSKCDNSNDEDESSTRSHMALQCKIKMGEIPFPIQRDIACGLHQMLKSCNCSRPGTKLCRTCSSERPLCKKSKGTCTSRSNNVGMGAGSSTDVVMRNACGDPCRSKSDTTLKDDKCSKIVKVMWAVARINIFQNNFRTYEILEASTTPPCKVPNKTEGIFVVKSQKKSCSSSPRKKAGTRY